MAVRLQAHGPINPPSGSTFTSIPVGNGGEEIAAFWTQDPKNSTSTHAFVMIHGKIRNGDEYWTTLNDALTSAIKDNYPGAHADDIVTAPQFFSTKYNSGQYTDEQLAFGDVNGWQAGDIATHPAGTKLTSIDALDAFVDEFADQTKYPSMKNLTIVGHGGGGQLIARYAQVAKDPPSNLHVRYIFGDPSSNSYFTKDRPEIDPSIAQISNCSLYNTWRYGYDNFTGTAAGKLTPQEYFATYIRRDAVSIVGYEDTDASGDTYCMANLQGGTKRRDRNLCWYQYVNGLARTDEVLDGFPCNYTDLPDWSNLSANAISTRLVVVRNADHDAGEVFGSTEGRSTLFDDKNLEVGWRPDGWKASTKAVTPGVTAVLGGNSSSSSDSSSSSGSSSKSKSSSTDSASASKASSSGMAASAATSLTVSGVTAMLSAAVCLGAGVLTLL